MSIRTERVASLIKQELGSIISRDFNDSSYGFITVTEVSMSPDLKNARIYLSVFGADGVREKAMAMLQDNKQQIRGLVASRVQLKFAPALHFHLDTTLDEVDRINRLIAKIHTDEVKRDDDKDS